MKNRFFYYKNTYSFPSIELGERFNYFYFTPSLFVRKKHKGIYRHSNVLYFIWYLLTLGKYRILYIVDKETKEIAHFINIMPKIFKYKFMGRNDLHIVHAYTFEKYRGMRLFSFSFSKIQEDYNNIDIWAGAHVKHKSSHQILERSGFKRSCSVEKSKILGIYEQIDE
jgi:hypothetical protein